MTDGNKTGLADVTQCAWRHVRIIFQEECKLSSGSTRDLNQTTCHPYSETVTLSILIFGQDSFWFRYIESA